MSDETIPPALTPDEWADRGTDPRYYLRYVADAADGGPVTEFEARLYHQAVALANAALPDGDLRKITPLHVDALRRAAEELDREQYNVGAIECRVVANMLAAILSPTGGENAAE